MKTLKAIRCKGYSLNMHAFANLEIQIRKLCYIRRYQKWNLYQNMSFDKWGFKIISFLNYNYWKCILNPSYLFFVGTPYTNSINLHSHVSWHLTNWIIFGCCRLASIPYLLITFVNNILCWFFNYRPPNKNQDEDTTQY